MDLYYKQTILFIQERTLKFGRLRLMEKKRKKGREKIR